MDKHTLKIYDEELALLDQKIAQMGGLAEQQFDQSINALERRDLKLAEEVVASDRSIDLLQREIVEQIISMVARRQPVAVDLRHIVGALQITTELERIGDLAKNIAKRALTIADEPHPKPLMSGIRQMAELALTQLKEVLEAYAERDAEKALAVWRHDAQIDAMYNSLFRELLIHDGGPAQYRHVHSSLVRRQEHRARRRPHHQYCRDSPLPRARLRYR